MREHRLTTARRARYYTLGGGDRPPAELWMVAHGFGQLAGYFIKHFDAVAREDRLIVAPEALNRFYVESGTAGSRADARVGATWMTKEDRESEIADYVDFLDSVYAEVVPPGARVTALGFSQGVATVARWLSHGRSRVDRLVLWAGQIPPDLELSRFRDRLPGGIVLVDGTGDEYALWVKVGENQARLSEAGLAFETLTFYGGHRLDEALLRRLAAT